MLLALLQWASCRIYLNLESAANFMSSMDDALQFSFVFKKAMNFPSQLAAAACKYPSSDAHTVMKISVSSLVETVVVPVGSSTD